MTGAARAPAGHVLDTERLALRELHEGDAGFMLALLNEPSFHQYIGDRGVRTVDEACAYLRDGPMASYAAHGFGLWLVLQKEDGAPVGICGLLKRETLADVDLGFAFRPAYWRRGYALESGAAVLAHGRTAYRLRRVVAVTQADNAGSIRVLEKLGLRFERLIEWPGDAASIQLFARDFE